MLSEIIGPDLMIVLAIVALLFGSSQLPKLARSIGQAKGEFTKGLSDGDIRKAEESTAITAQKPETN